MIKFFIIFLFPIFIYSSQGIDEINLKNEIAKLENLITVTESNINNQKEIKENLEIFTNDYLLLHEQSNNIKIAQKTIKSASNLIKSISNSDLEHLFSKQFLEDISFIATLDKTTDITA